MGTQRSAGHDYEVAARSSDWPERMR